MSTRQADSPMNSGSTKRKHHSLSISKKVEVLRKLEEGASVKRVSEEYGVGTSTIYDLKKQKEQILKFYDESDGPKCMDIRKTLHQAKNVDLDKVLLEWIRRRRSEKAPVHGALIINQAKQFHEELGITTSCDYSSGWFTKFKKRHGILLLKVCGEKEKSSSSDKMKKRKQVDAASKNGEGTSGYGVSCSSSGEELLRYSQEESTTETDIPLQCTIQRLCRLCLAELDSYTNIYEFDEFHRFNVADAINDLLGLSVNPDDGYPERICTACLNEVAHFKHFKGICYESKIKLGDILSDSNYNTVNIKMESEKDIFEAVENEINELPVKCEVADEFDKNVDSENDSASMFSGCRQSCSNIGQNFIEIPHQSEEELGIDNDNLVYCDPLAVTGDNDATDIQKHSSNSRNELQNTSLMTDEMDCSTASIVSPVVTKEQGTGTVSMEKIFEKRSKSNEDFNSDDIANKETANRLYIRKDLLDSAQYPSSCDKSLELKGKTVCETAHIPSDELDQNVQGLPWKKKDKI